MTDVVPEEGQGPENSQVAPQIRVVTQFVRDLSFENPRAPDSLRTGEGAPSMDMNVEMSARGRADALFEVDLKISCTAKQGDEVSFQIELVYGGLFEIANVPDEHMEGVLLVECPRFLFPFVRRIIGDATIDGGFPPFLMEPLDFAAIYNAQRQGQAPGQVLQ